eukprot:gene17622-20076_t
MSEGRREKRKCTQGEYNAEKRKKQCVRQRSPSLHIASDVNIGDVNADAQKFLKEYDARTQFWECGVCGIDEGLVNLRLIDGAVVNRIEQSDLPSMFSMVKESLGGLRTGNAEYLRCLEQEFYNNGLLKSARYICNSCHKCLKKGKNTVTQESCSSSTGVVDSVCEKNDSLLRECGFLNVDSDDGNSLRGEYDASDEEDRNSLQGKDGEGEEIESDCDDEEDDEFELNAEMCEPRMSVKWAVPRTAYIPGLYPGIIPEELKDLRVVEMSMISIYNPVTRLKLNSKDVHIAYPEDWNSLDADAEIEPESMIIDAIEEEEIERANDSVEVGDTEDNDVEKTNGTNDGAMNEADATKDILLVENSEIVSQLESLRDIVNAEKVRKKKRNTIPIMERSSAENVYVNMYTSPEYYWEKCFPTLYPYGRGGPSDPFYNMKDLQTYFAHVLSRGDGGKDGRRFQNNPGHMFVAYTYEIKRRVKNMAYAATRDDTTDTTKSLTSQAVVSSLVDCLAQSVEDETLDIEELYKRTKQQRTNASHTNEASSGDKMNSDITASSSTSSSSSTVASGGETIPNTSIAEASEDVVNDDDVLQQIKRLMQRLPQRRKKNGTAQAMQDAPLLETNEYGVIENMHDRKGGEENLFRGYDSAVVAFEALKGSNELPTNVLTQIATFTKSEDLLNDLGDVVHLDQNELPDKDDDDSENSDSDVDGMNAIVDDDALSDDDKDEVDISESTNSDTLNNTGSANDVQVISKGQIKYLKTFVKNEAAVYMNKYTEENSSNDMSNTGTNNNTHVSNTNHKGRIPLKDEEERKRKLKERVARLTPDQRSAYDAIMRFIKDINEDMDTSEGVIQFVTGGAVL